MFQINVNIVKTPTVGIKTELVYATKTNTFLKRRHTIMPCLLLVITTFAIRDVLRGVHP